MAIRKKKSTFAFGLDKTNEMPKPIREARKKEISTNITTRMKISIVTAAYKSATTIEDTIRSVLRQTYAEFEHIIVDGGPDDGTPAIVERYRSQYDGRLKYIREADKGLYDAMNKGIRQATGDVVGLLNSDDFYSSEDILEQVATALSDADIDAIYGDVRYVDQQDITRTVRYYSSRIFSRGWMRLGFMPAHPSFYCRREVYSEHGMFDLSYKVAADFEQLLRLIYVHRIRTRYLNTDFVTMRTGGTSNANLQSRLQIMKDHRRALRTNGIYSNTLLLSLRYIYKAGEVLWAKIVF